MIDLAQAIDPDATRRRWIHEFTWHLDAVPAIMDALIEMTLPHIPVSRGGSRFDKDQITGGGFFDNMQMLDTIDKGPVADARDLWSWVVQYTRAVDAWIAAERPAPVLTDSPNPDPNQARGEALVTAGWLIDHAEQIADVQELEEHREAMFQLIRHLRGRYGVFNMPRRGRPELCMICGEHEVRTRWESGTVGPRSVEVKKCRTCGDEQREPEPAPERSEITHVDGKPIRRVGGLTDADRAAFRALVEATKRKIEEKAA